MTSIKRNFIFTFKKTSFIVPKSRIKASSEESLIGDTCSLIANSDCEEMSCCNCIYNQCRNKLQLKALFVSVGEY